MLVERIDGNLFEFYACAAAAAGKACARRAGFSYVALRPSPWPNSVFGLDYPEGEDLPPALAQGIREGSIPNKVRTGPTSRPSDVERRLADALFVLDDVTWGMTLDLSGRRRVPPPPGLSLSPLEADADFLAAVGIVATELIPAKAEAWPAFAGLLAAMGRNRAFGFLGRVGDACASTAFAFIDGEGVGGVYFVATDAAMRRRGFAAATTSAILDELARRGVGSCVLHATELGRPVYEGLGFKVECRLARYHLSAAVRPG
jgi:ribosomal protein S18 acetylase RimI-like enzyme